MIKGGPKIVTDGLKLCLDAHDAKSYAGEPASNLNSDTNDYTGTSYGNITEWSSNPTRLSKSYDSTIKTPIGTGATLIQESGTNGYHHLSRMGGSETGNHTISFYFKPVTSDINNLKIGMLGDSNPIITFDFTQSPATVTQTGSVISGKLALLAPLSNGWYFCAADFNGRFGGWVGSVGFNINAEYTGVSGSKKAYICGLNYNNKAYAVPSFDRSATDGWVDRSGNSNSGTLTNMIGTGVTHYRDGEVIMPVSASYLDLDGSDDYIDGPIVAPNIGAFTYEAVIYRTSSDFLAVGSGTALGGGTNMRIFVYDAGMRVDLYAPQGLGGGWKTGNTIPNISNTFVDNNTYYVTVVNDGTVFYFYKNGVSLGSYDHSYLSNTGSTRLGILRNHVQSVGGTGRVYLARMYDKALTAAEVLQNYNATKGRFS
jgi:hypothetical protein